MFLLLPKLMFEALTFLKIFALDYRLIKCIFLVQFLSLEFIKFTSRTALFSSQIVVDINNFNV